MFEYTLQEVKERRESKFHRNPDERGQNEQTETPAPNCRCAAPIRRHWFPATVRITIMVESVSVASGGFLAAPPQASRS
jgi:hypothetical protein